MSANTGRITLELVVDDRGSVALSNAALRGISALDGLRVKSSSVANRMRASFKTVQGAIGGILKRLLNWKTALAGLVGGYGLGQLAKSAIGVASSFENMRLSLDTLTQGQGAATLNELNEWALKMPVNTQKAVQSFIMMRAMGLQPTIDQMTTLVDTMSALGGNADTLEGIARALGQIQTKGKVSAEELMQLAERGVPVFEILRERFGEVDTATLNAGEAIAAIFDGLEQRFGGMSEKQQSAWSGMMKTIKSYWTEFQRLVMDSGVFEHLKTKAGEIVSDLDGMFRSGKAQEFAQTISDKVVLALKQAEIVVRSVKTEFTEWVPKLKEIWDILKGFVTVLKTVASLFNVVGKGIGNFAGWLSVGAESAADQTRKLSAAGTNPSGKVGWDSSGWGNAPGVPAPAASASPGGTTSGFSQQGFGPPVTKQQNQVDIYVQQATNGHQVAQSVKRELERIGYRSGN